MEEIFGSLTRLIKNSKNVIIMAHKNIDLDAFASALCLFKIVESFDKPVCICLNKKNLNTTVKKAIREIEINRIKFEFISKSSIFKYVKEETLLIILDTSRKQLLEEPKIVNIVKNIVILDHHVVTNKNILNTKLSYINSSLSSTSEILAKYLQYSNIAINPLIATIMLAGIDVDTNSFNVKVTEETFKVAAFLKSLGASNLIKQQILKENKEDYFKREKYVEHSYMVNDTTAICLVDDNILSKEDLAIISEKLLTFDNVKVSFTISYISSDVVGISARSISEFNVYKIMKLFGGGGHLNEAASQIKGTTVKEVEEKLTKILEG